MLKIIIKFVLGLVLVRVEAKNWVPDCTGDVFNGVCVDPKHCFSTNPYISGLKYPLPCTTEYGDLGVCCTDCELTHNANGNSNTYISENFNCLAITVHEMDSRRSEVSMIGDAVLDQSSNGLLWKTGEKAWDKCLEYVQKYKYFSCNIINNMMRRNRTEEQCHFYTNHTTALYVAGGTDVSRGEYPHMALLGYKGTKDPSEWLCSGSLISERFILTAAHCSESRDLGPVTEAAFGMLKRSDPAENWHRYSIKRVIPHPGYELPFKYHDIALLETEIPVKFINETVLPACLPAHDNFINYNNVYGITAAGWGRLGYLRDLADTLQKVVVTKFNGEECDDMYPTHRLLRNGLDHSAQMCYGHKKVVKDTCQGDSGGPLQIDSGHPSCIQTIIGVTSFGHECGFEGQSGVYIRVSKYLRWIESVVWP